jgi:hypothetical protein
MTSAACTIILMADLDFAPVVKSFKESLLHQSRMTCSAVVLASTAILNSQLEKALKKTMRQLPNKLYERLFETFGAPLNSFFSKIVMARALGVITDEVYDELEKIRLIRNRFAHTSVVLNFESDEIAPIFQTLKRPQKAAAKTNLSQVFLDCVTVIHDELEVYATKT